MEIFFLNSKDIYKMTKFFLDNCMFWDACHCTTQNQGSFVFCARKFILIFGTKSWYIINAFLIWPSANYLQLFRMVTDDAADDDEVT